MKDLLALFSLVILLMIMPIDSASGQWYKRQYGVNSLYELRNNQLEEALLKTNRIIKSGNKNTLVGVGVLGVGAGLIILPGEPSSWEGFYRNLYIGTAALLIGVPSIIVGITKMTNGAKRKSTILKVYGNDYTQISIFPSITWHQNQSYIGAKLTFPFTK